LTAYTFTLAAYSFTSYRSSTAVKPSWTPVASFVPPQHVGPQQDSSATGKELFFSIGGAQQPDWPSTLA
jgi:hypothetical protein